MTASATIGEDEFTRPATVVLADGSSYLGTSFGAERSVAGEAVFQTGMVGYAEAITDPSYEGQLLVITFPLVGNYGVPSHEECDANGLPRHFESSRIHVAGLIVSDYSLKHSHWRAVESLSEWLRRENVPAVFNVDTRALTKRIRNEGVMLGKILMDGDPTAATLAFSDPNERNLVAEVSCKEPRVYSALNPDGTILTGEPKARVLAVDTGMKYNQIRCFVRRGIELKVVPWNHDFVADTYTHDGLFLSNGPGDPTMCQIIIDRLAALLKSGPTRPIFGICLGHQLLSLAAGGSTVKLKFGNRGHNIPCVDRRSGRCFITTQNHGYAVDAASLDADTWSELFYNANDQTNEGIIHHSLPIFSVQFHPESAPGPHDTEFLFDYFLESMLACRAAGSLQALPAPPRVQAERVVASKVLILGSGGLSIGQAGEFDYSGSQAIKSLKEEGISTVLINPNIATIQTSAGLADKVYFLPVTPEFVLRVIDRERPDGILVTFGGQTALNCAIQIKEELEKRNVRVLGTKISTIESTEDREVFAEKMREINEPVAVSEAAVTVDEAIAAANRIGYPVICRAAFALGGLGSGFANNDDELRTLATHAFANSPQVLIELSMKGWKEVEYEVVRDCVNNCITVCNMENFDPLGIHTGDSIVVAPSQTLSDREYHLLRDSSIKCIRHLGVVGECNIQFALDPNSERYCIIEVNARLSRSSALASKATGYPLAFVAAKLALNITLPEIKNAVTRVTCACFEPSLDYIVCKFPRWDLKKFDRVSTKISSSMKSVGEVMSISRSFEEGLQKAIRALDDSFDGFIGDDKLELTASQVDDELRNPTDQRVFVIARAMEHDKATVDQIHELTKIDKWFLHKLERVVNLRRTLRQTAEKHSGAAHDDSTGVLSHATLSPALLRLAKQLGFSDRQVARAVSSTELAVRARRVDMGLMPCVKQIDTVAAEFPAFTNYLYTTFSGSESDVTFDTTTAPIVVLGSGVYRIGSSVEFDWCAVRAIRTLRAAGRSTIMVNYNPETVSTDYDEADRLYFENITLETVLDITTLESAGGVIISMGGQVPNNIAMPLSRQNVRILGTSPIQIDMAENRYKFSRLLDSMGVQQPQWKELTQLEEAASFCERVSYPVLVRPSYVLSGAAMAVVHSYDDLSMYLGEAVRVSREHPVVISKYIGEAKEIDVDCVAHDGKLVMHLVSEHVENAGVHSGDATLLQPPQDLDDETKEKLHVATARIVKALHVTGPCNIQFIAKNKDILVIECNVRASRSFPFVSKTSGVDMIELATQVMCGLPYTPYPLRNYPRPGYVGVKVPMFSFSRLQGADPVMGVEMASTGEVACFGKDRYEAYLKALFATGFKMPPPKGNILLSIGLFREKAEFLASVCKLHDMGFQIFATPGTSDYYCEHGIPVKPVDFLGQGNENELLEESNYSLVQKLSQHMIDMYVCLPSQNSHRRPGSYMSRGYVTRRLAVDRQIPLITNIKCAKLLIEGMSRFSTSASLPISQLDCQGSAPMEHMVAPVNLCPLTKESDAIAAAKGGFGLVSFVDTVGSEESLAAMRTQLASGPCDYALFVSWSSKNTRILSVSRTAGVLVDLYLPETTARLELEGPSSLANAMRACFDAERPVFVRATGSRLAAALMCAQMAAAQSDASCRVHVSQVRTHADLELVQQVRFCVSELPLSITCDVDPILLMLESDEAVQAYAKASVGPAPTLQDVQAMWTMLSAIDCFATGARQAELALTVVMGAVAAERLTVDQVVERMHRNPLRVLGVSAVRGSQVEMARTSGIALEGAVRTGAKVERLSVRGETMVSNGVVIAGQLAALDCHSLAYRNSGTEDELTNESATSVPRKSPSHVRIRLGSSTSSALDGSISMLSSSSTAAAAAGALGSSATALSSSGAAAVAMASASDLTEASASLPQRHMLTVKGITRGNLHALFRSASEMRTMFERQGTVDFLKNRILATLFYEPSTRTQCSFVAAMQRLGGQCIDVSPSTSSIQKGESLADTVRCVECYADAIVVRHPTPGSVQEAAKHASVPVINGGDGIGEHPTQALLDLFTIREELGTVNGLTVTFVGDLLNGRTCHSLVQLLLLYHVKLNFVSHASLCMPDDVQAAVDASGVTSTRTERLTDVLAQTDVLYVTRVQKERFASEEEYNRVRDVFKITPAVLQGAKQKCIVMHPLPRVDEISPEVDYDPRAVYFRQMKYGLYVRAALLYAMLGGPNKLDF